MSESQTARPPSGALLSEFAALIDHKAFPLLEQALMHVGEEKRHKGVLQLFFASWQELAVLLLAPHLAGSGAHLLQVALELRHSGKVLL